jgi:SAM-dependent methyltransferase
MSQTPLSSEQVAAEFDAVAAEYDAALNQGLAASGESKEYFARGRLNWVRRWLQRLEAQPRDVLDYGCGTGTATPFLLECLKAETIVGVDVSASSLEVARRDHGSEKVQFAEIDRYTPEAQFDLAYCNGVFHHIPLEARAGSVQYVLRSLRPGGLFAFWENNPWNPGTRYVMSKIPFDRDAITLTPPEARQLLQTNGFEVIATNFLFIFPGSLGFLRVLEPPLARLPLGGQYMVLCRKSR